MTQSDGPRLGTRDLAGWTARYDRPDYVFGTEPAAFLVREGGRIASGGRVLCVADGEGRNSVWLAGRGLDVHAVEGAPTAVAKARALAARAGAAVALEVADLESWRWPEAAYDAVVAIFIQFAGPAFRERLFAGMRRALRPGGLLLLHGYTPKQLDYGTGGPSQVENLYDEALLRAAFPDFAPLVLRSYDAVIEEGPGHSGVSALIDFVARKPG